MNDNPALATTSVERPVARNIFGRLWANKLAKEFILMLGSVVAVQLALGMTDLLGIVETVKDWGDLMTSLSAWAGAFSFALVVSIVKQSLAWGIARLARTKL